MVTWRAIRRSAQCRGGKDLHRSVISASADAGQTTNQPRKPAICEWVNGATAPNPRSPAGPPESVGGDRSLLIRSESEGCILSTTARTTATPAAPSPAAKTAKKRTRGEERRASGDQGAQRPRSARTPARTTTAKPNTGALPVRSGEEPWTAEEIAEVEADLRAEVDRLRADVASADQALGDLLREAGTGAGGRPGRHQLEELRARARDVHREQRPRHAQPVRARAGPDRGRHLRGLRVLRRGRGQGAAAAWSSSPRPAAGSRDSRKEKQERR